MFKVRNSRFEYLKSHESSGSGTESDVKQKRVEPFDRSVRTASEGDETRSPATLLRVVHIG